MNSLRWLTPVNESQYKLTSKDAYQRQALAYLLADFDLEDDVMVDLLQEMAESR